MAKKVAETPLMKQYNEMKQKHPDAVLLFRVGDFYETFCDDAVMASDILGITLTRRANGSASSIELAGFPHHALDTYLPKLVRAGKRVAICEQLEDPKTTNKLVKRGITELVTPGVTMDDTVLDHKLNNFLASLHLGTKGDAGVAFLDISTGEFLTTEGTVDEVDKLLSTFDPREIIVQSGLRRRVGELFGIRTSVNEVDDWAYSADSTMERLLRQFGTNSLKGFGIADKPLAIIASGAALHYLDITQHKRTSHINSISRIESDTHVRLDRFTMRSLELTQALGEGGMSLLDVIDRTVSPMGSRMLRRWVQFPLRDIKSINDRLDVVEYFFRDPGCREELHGHLETIGDLERLNGKLATGRITPREVVQLRNALRALEPVQRLCAGADLASLNSIGERLNPCIIIRDRITRELNDDAPAQLSRGGVISRGVDAELDRLRDIAYRGKDYLLQIQAREQQATGITSLKIGYNKVFGYYIEVTNTHRDKVPAEWIRKQTLVNGERYITPELKEYEEQIINAQDNIQRIEERLYNGLVTALADYVPTFRTDAMLIARLDCLLSLTEVAAANRYNRPVIDDSLTIELVEERHPVIERRLPAGTQYITNTVRLDNDATQLMMITGPNMSGKSALLRSTALNVLLAQIGSFVAADSARIGVVDKIFTRVGASDNISLGESTFMVEMNEAASILNNMSRRSLILFDELGRGTSTYDGISIAWSIAEYILKSPLRPKTLFATHYHELNDMERSYERVANYNVSVSEIDGKVVFLRKLQRGGSEHSFGIHVARLAGMPAPVVDRADKVLRQLEANSTRNANRDGCDAPAANGAMPGAVSDPTMPPVVEGGVQLSFFQLDDPVLSQVRDRILGLDIDNLTPLAALTTLNDIRSILTGKCG